MVGLLGFAVAAHIQAVVPGTVLVGQHRWAELPAFADACYVAASNMHVAAVGQLAVALFARTLLDLPHYRQMVAHSDLSISVVVVVAVNMRALVDTQLDSNSFLFLSRL
jgi:hypothetical protein